MSNLESPIHFSSFLQRIRISDAFSMLLLRYTVPARPRVIIPSSNIPLSQRSGTILKRIPLGRSWTLERYPTPCPVPRSKFSPLLQTALLPHNPGLSLCSRIKTAARAEHMSERGKNAPFLLLSMLQRNGSCDVCGSLEQRPPESTSIKAFLHLKLGLLSSVVE